MRSKIVPISIPEELLSQVDSMAKKEFRSRSEFFREAVRSQIAKKQIDLFNQIGQKQAQRLGIVADDVPQLVNQVRDEIRLDKHPSK